MIYNHFDDHHLNILDGKYYVSLVQIIIPLILLTVFSSVIGISLKYYAKSIFSILICVIIGFSPIFF
jgi:hypothetical protein